MISRIRDNSEEVADNKRIKKAFYTVFSKLYQKQEIPLDKIENYLNNQNLPKLSQIQKTRINSPITNQEIIDAIKKLKIGKTPGPDGISTGYYKYGIFILKYEI